MLIGSSAMRIHFPDFDREPKDADYFTDQDLVMSSDVFWHESFPEAWSKQDLATVDQLYTIKVSHSFWDLHGTWAKHMHDIHFLQEHGAKFDRDMYDILYPVWVEKHGKKRTMLNMSKDEFFSDAVVRKYDHDSLHMSVAYNDRPVYESVLKDGSEVLTDKSKFDRLPYVSKLQLMREEIYATALERWVVPSNYTFSPRAAYARALKKTVTSLMKGDWALWLVLNYSELYKPDMDYVQQHKSKSHHLILL